MDSLVIAARYAASGSALFFQGRAILEDSVCGFADRPGASVLDGGNHRDPDSGDKHGGDTEQFVA